MKSGAWLGAALALALSQTAAAEPLETKNAGESLARDKGCLHCHAVDSAKIGPSFVEIARRNRKLADSDLALRNNVRNGTAMHWKTGPWSGTMPPAKSDGRPLKDEEVDALVYWILGLR